MARKQYRGVMVADFEVDGSFQTVARLEQLWKEAAEEIERKLAEEVPEAKVSASGSADQSIQAELQDRRGSTGDIKNIVFRGGRGKNEKMSRSQMVRLEELWRKRWYELNLNSDPRADLKGEEKKLFNKLNHMAGKENLVMDESLGRLRNKNTTAMAYTGGSIDQGWRFANKVRDLELKFSYDPSDDALHGKIMRKIINGDLEGLEKDIFDWEMSAADMMPDDQAVLYKTELRGKFSQADQMRTLMAGDKHLMRVTEMLDDDQLLELGKSMTENPSKQVKGLEERVVTLRSRKGKNYRMTVDPGMFKFTSQEFKTLFESLAAKRKGSKTVRMSWLRSVKDENGNPADAETVFTAEGVSQEELDKLWKAGKEGGFATRG